MPFRCDDLHYVCLSKRKIGKIALFSKLILNFAEIKKAHVLKFISIIKPGDE